MIERGKGREVALGKVKGGESSIVMEGRVGGGWGGLEREREDDEGGDGFPRTAEGFLTNGMISNEPTPPNVSFHFPAPGTNPIFLSH